MNIKFLISTTTPGGNKVEAHTYTGPVLLPGMKLVTVMDFTTPAYGKEAPPIGLYLEGYEFELLERTSEAPWGAISSLGNWRVKCHYHESSVWSHIEVCMARNLIVIKE